MIKIIGFWLGVDVLGFPNIHFHKLIFKNEYPNNKNILINLWKECFVNN